mgnify:CR=1 FL=1|jgi:hypothetical protein|tara:strand:- start:74 stop:334 length:261 start_codon:yes stop_codon:yes gene_type:complete
MSEEFEDFEDFEEFEIEEGDEEFEEDFDREMLASLIETAAATALKLTELVVDNNHRNNVKMEEGDIYRIHSESFASSFASIVQGQQ